MKKVLAIIILLVCLIPMVVSASPSIEVVDWNGDGRWRHDTWYIDLSPGERASIELEIESSEDAVVYVEYDMPRNLMIYFDPPALEIEEDDTEWIEITVYTPGDIEPGEYEIDFYFKAMEVETRTETETEIIYRNRYLTGPERIKYVDRVEYVDRYIQVPKYAQYGIDWWWVPISIIFSVLLTLLISEAIRREWLKR